MGVGVAIWIALLPVFWLLIHLYFLRGFFLKRHFYNSFGKENCFVQWSTEDGPFPLTTYMQKEGVSIIAGKGNVALNRAITLFSKLPKYITYCTVLVETNLPEGIYGSGWVVGSYKPNVLLPKGLPLSDVSSLFNPKHVPEAVEIIDGKAYIHFPLNNWFGSKGIKDAYLCSTTDM